jgi:hypothetical protein
MAGEERGWTVHVGEELMLEVLEERVDPEGRNAAT